MARTPYSNNSYTGGANAATIVATGIGAADTTITITGTLNSSWSPLGNDGGFYLALDYGSVSEEKIFVPSGSWTYSNTGVTFSGVTRGIDFTTAQTHGTTGYVTPVITSTDISEANTLTSIFLGNSTNVAVNGFTVSGLVTINPLSTAITGTNNQGQFSVGGPLSFSDNNQLATFTSNVNNYAQISVQNTSSGSAATTSINVWNNLASGLSPITYLGGIGINSSNFTGAGTLNLPNAVLFTAASGELAIGTNYGGGIHFTISGSSASSYDSIVVSGNGTIGINGPITVSGSLTISGSANPVYTLPPSYVSPFKAWTHDSHIATATQILMTGTAYYHGIWVGQPMTISGISFYASTFVNTDTAYLGLFNATNQVATCSGFKGGSTGLLTAQISGGTYAITTPGMYWVGLVISGASSFTCYGPVAGQASLVNMNVGTQTNTLSSSPSATLRIGSVVIGNRALYGNGGSISGTIAGTTLTPWFALS